MKRSSLILLCLIFGWHAFAQNKKEDKLLRLYESGNYDKLEKKAKKILVKDRKNKYANYVLCSMYLAHYPTQKSTSSKKAMIAKSLRYFKQLPTNEYEDLSNNLHLLIRKNALDSNLKASINNQYRNWLLMYFNDSVPDRTMPSISTAIVFGTNTRDDSLRSLILQTAQKLEGVPYLYAGTNPAKGFDCSGFTQYVYKTVGIDLPHNAHKQSVLSTQQKSLDELEPGDLIFFGSWNGNRPRTGHAGIVYRKNGNKVTVIHCVSGGVKIEGENSSWDRYWIDKVLYGISLDTLAHQ